MKKISVIIVYTNEAQLDEAVGYLNKQSISDDMELILLDNRNKKFISAAEALNYGANIAVGDVLIFMHQDVYLWDLNILEKYYNYLKSNDNTIAGVAGVASKDKKVYYDIYETKDKIRRAQTTGSEIMPAETIDECFFAMKKALWQRLKFDEITCDSWHFYGAEICYNNLLSGGKNVIYSSVICHESMGNSKNKDFRISLKKLIKKYKHKLKRIETTCINIKCKLLSYYRYCLKCYIKRLLNYK